MKQNQQSQMELVQLTPALAQELLATNAENNRTVTKRQLAKVMAAIRKGEWRVTGDTIKIDRNGRMFDGQHRCLAVLETGITVWTWIARNLDPEAYMLTDTNRPRYAADVLQMQGNRYAATLAASLRVVWFIERKRLDFNVAVPNTDIVETLRQHPDIQVHVADFFRYKYFRSGRVIGSAYWLEQCNRKRGEQFVQGFMTGAELKQGDPVYQLRERIVNMGGASKDKIPPVHVLGMFFRCWAWFLEGTVKEVLKAQQYTAENMPWPKFGPYLDK